MSDGAAGVFVAASRARALTRGVFLWIPAGVGFLIIRAVWPRLYFIPSGFSNRIEDYSFALVLAGVALIALVCAWKGLRWMVFAAWPGRVGIEADRAVLVLRLGPFGTDRLDAARLAVVYPFEQPPETRGDGVEAFLPEDEQIRTLLPHLSHPDAREDVRTRMLAFIEPDEKRLAQHLVPVLRLWRGEAPTEATGL